MKTTLANDRKEALARRRTDHHKALEALRHPSCNDSGLQMWRKLRKLENIASNAATAQCNAEAYGGQPFREGNDWENFVDGMKNRVKLVFGHLPKGFCFNSDPRGYALKIDSENVKLPEGMHSDWGGYGILAPVID